jgi:hypothetical protein
MGGHFFIVQEFTAEPIEAANDRVRKASGKQAECTYANSRARTQFRM